MRADVPVPIKAAQAVPATISQPSDQAPIAPSALPLASPPGLAETTGVVAAPPAPLVFSPDEEAEARDFFHHVPHHFFLGAVMQR